MENEFQEKSPKLNSFSFGENILNRLVSGGLKNSIDQHGSISRRLIKSAAKRICGQIEGYMCELIKKKMQSEQPADLIVIPKEKYEKMCLSIERKNKSIQDLVNKLKELGQLS